MRYATERRAAQSPHLSDLYLACACAAGDAHAVQLLERDYLSKVPGVLRRQRRAPETIEEVCQSLRATLIGQGHISTYTGEGKLWSWIEVIAKRMANKEDRARKGSSSSESQVAGLPAPGGNAERDAIKRTVLAELQVALREAGSALSDEQRELLRFHYRNGMSESKLAKLFGTSQPTISRRLSKAKDLIFQETRRVLQERLQIGESDFESYLAEIRSRWLDLSLSQVFGRSGGSDPPPS
jgi:RNA polymerase sigma-70 factor